MPETGENWTNLLPFAFLQARCTPNREGFSPLKSCLVNLPLSYPKLGEELKAKSHNHSLLKSLQALQYTQRATLLVALVRDALLVLTSDPVHPFQPGDSVWAKKFTTQGLTPTWKGLYTVALLTASRPGGTTPSSCTRKLPGS